MQNAFLLIRRTFIGPICESEAFFTNSKVMTNGGPNAPSSFAPSFFLSLFSELSFGNHSPKALLDRLQERDA